MQEKSRRQSTLTMLMRTGAFERIPLEDMLREFYPHHSPGTPEYELRRREENEAEHRLVEMAKNIESRYPRVYRRLRSQRRY